MNAPKKNHQRRQLLVALGVVKNEKGEILVARRNDPKNKYAHNKWEFPGGKVEFGEHPSQAALREVKEEVGIAAITERLINIYTWHHPERPHIQIILVVYLLRMSSPGQQPRAANREVKEVRFVTPQKAMTMDQLPKNREIVRDIIKSL